MNVTGRVVRGLPRVPIRLIGPAGTVYCHAVVDSGFSDQLTISEALRQQLGAAASESAEAAFADALPRTLPLARVRVDFGGDAWLQAEALVTGEVVLVGMDLLHGHRLTVDCTEGGAVTIVPLSQSPEDTP